MSAKKQRLHFIAIGGSAMHNLALALHQKGFHVTGSDDELFEPSKSRLSKYGLLPESLGWDASKITTDLDAVILGMHAREDNPELVKAREIGLKIYSYPEYIFEQSKEKQRVVIAGSHGKTTITSMIIHVLQYHKKSFDYMAGALQDGFETMVKLSDAPVIIIEGDEYPSSALDKKPKFLHYNHHIGLINGVAWDHINVYPTFDDYVKQFETFADSSRKAGVLIYPENDDVATLVGRKEREDVQRIEYGVHDHEIKNGVTYLISPEGKFSVDFFGKHNMNNLSGAKAVCARLGITDAMFYKAIPSFKGPQNRLEVLEKNEATTVFKDFAHSPSKLKASTNAVSKQFSDRKLVSVFELHTFSSLNKEFLSQYKDCFKGTETSVVYYNPEVIEHKKLEQISTEEVINAFNHPNLHVFTSSSKLQDFLLTIDWNKKNLLFMTSGSFDGLDFKEFAKKIVNK
ncbi:MAG: UDP-N-acetylmuramate--L-alanine ligase [Cytophagaceae bacterium]